jgi:hypothetical protein
MLDLLKKVIEVLGEGKTLELKRDIDLSLKGTLIDVKLTGKIATTIKFYKEEQPKII